MPTKGVESQHKLSEASAQKKLLKITAESANRGYEPIGIAVFPRISEGNGSGSSSSGAAWGGYYIDHSSGHTSEFFGDNTKPTEGGQSKDSWGGELEREGTMVSTRGFTSCLIET